LPSLRLDRLDKRGRGFLEPVDWADKEVFNAVQIFSTRYMQKFMGVPDVSSTPDHVRKGARGGGRTLAGRAARVPWWLGTARL
jgi:hypothetical protein